MSSSPSPITTQAEVGLLAPGHPDYDAATLTFNTLVDLRADAVVAPANEAEAIAAVQYARRHGLRIAPQATGHNAAPLGALDGTMLISTSKLQSIDIDVATRRVRVGAGVKWEKVVPHLSAKGLAGLHGSSPDVGIAGYSLGGGMGWLARKHGLQTNSVTAFEIVLADGRFVRADQYHEPDLFWALRGGNGNFGVVTAIEFAVYPVEELYAGAMFFPIERAGDVIHTWNASLASYPEELMTWAVMIRFPDLPEVPDVVRGGEYAILMAAYLGDEAEGQRLLRPIRELGPAMDTFAMVPPIALADLAMDPPEPLPFESKHDLLEELTPQAIDEMLDVVGAGTGSPVVLFQLRHLGGALSRRAPHAGARAALPGTVSLFAGGVAMDAATGERIAADLAGVQRAVADLRAGHYPNFVEEPADARSFFDDITWARLRRVKAAVDPGDVFKGNFHIPPVR